MRLPVNLTSAGDLQFVGDGTFEPYTNVSVVLTSDGQPSQCIFDGYVLSWQLHLDRVAQESSIQVWAQDASWLMSTSDTVREWSGLTDGEVANQIFTSYGFTPAAGNTDDDSPDARPRPAQPLPARDRPAVPARPRAAQRQALPRRLHRHARRAHRLLRHPRRRRRSRDDDHARRPRQLERRLTRLRLGRDAPQRSGRQSGSAGLRHQTTSSPATPPTAGWRPSTRATTRPTPGRRRRCC